MGFIMDLLTLPVLGAPRMVQWIASVLTETAEEELLDEGSLKGAISELQQRYEEGEIEEEEYDQQEKALLERLNVIRELKRQRG